ncbi:hypothetical protein [Actinomadura alba]|uniref:Uncharacterized protein n=1 Tax=Actinomadura alba TaxID=406431 RepID=A0ABR7LNV2_9ACTN|nr:hypothetical protein [Actinomadura alba]MBC6466353.1 hypothetical protein [Actinomadura alba]
MSAPLATSPLIVGKDVVTDERGKVVAVVRRPRVLFFRGWFRWFLWRHRARSFDLLGQAGEILCRVDEGGLGMANFRLTVRTEVGDDVGTVTALRTGPKGVKYVFTAAGGEVLGEGAFATKVRYGDIPKKLTHAFDDGAGTRTATADRKPGGGPHQVRFNGQISETYRMLAVCLLTVLPGSKLGAHPPAREALEPSPTEPMSGLFGGTSLEFHRDRVIAADGRMLATVGEPYVPAVRGISRALSHNPEVTRHRFDVAGPGGEPLFSVEKSSGAVHFDIEVTLPDGAPVGTIERSRGVARPTYTVTDGAGSALAEITSTEAFESDYEVVNPQGVHKAALSRIQAVDEPWTIRFGAGCDEQARRLVVAFIIVQELMLDL